MSRQLLDALIITMPVGCTLAVHHFRVGAVSLRSGRPIKESNADACSLGEGELRQRYASYIDQGALEVLLDQDDVSGSLSLTSNPNPDARGAPRPGRRTSDSRVPRRRRHETDAPRAPPERSTAAMRASDFIRVPISRTAAVQESVDAGRPMTNFAARKTGEMSGPFECASEPPSTKVRAERDCGPVTRHGAL
jgi:hypothetical protein